MDDSVEPSAAPRVVAGAAGVEVTPSPELVVELRACVVDDAAEGAMGNEATHGHAKHAKLRIYMGSHKATEWLKKRYTP